MDDPRYSFRTEKGLLVELRPMTSEDAPYLVDIFEHMSPQSRYQRFHQPLTHPDPGWIAEQARELATIDPPGKGWLAFADLPDQPSAPVGGGRFVVVEPGVAEVALTVRDDLQGQGIGTQILLKMIEDARAAGITKLVAMVQASNRAVKGLIKHGHLPIQCVTHQGETYIAIDLSDCYKD